MAKIKRIFVTISIMNAANAAEQLLYPAKMPILANAQIEAAKKRRRLDDLLREQIKEYDSEDTSLVVFGSLARGEWTSGSDLDWTYLIDGQANSDHLLIAQEIRRVIEKHKTEFNPPGQTGIFGNMAFSHDIVHQIGGHADTNKNMTQRILLLLESIAIGKGAAYERILKAVINRYLEEDTHLLMEDERHYRVPRFLLNDIVRFWRTMAVDFASKQRDRGGEGWGLRNAKLRMSRKLIFASGLLLCFSCNLDSELKKKISTEKSVVKLNLVNHIREHVKLSPLQLLAKVLPQYSVSLPIQEDLFSAYADFLEMLNDKTSRSELEELKASDSRTDAVFKRIKAISAVFDRSLDHIFFENVLINPLTRKYGVF